MKNQQPIRLYKITFRKIIVDWRSREKGPDGRMLSYSTESAEGAEEILILSAYTATDAITQAELRIPQMQGPNYENSYPHTYYVIKEVEPAGPEGNE